MKAKKGKTIGKRVAVLLGTAVIAVGLTYPAAAKSNEVVAEENTEKISIETSKLTDVETLLSLAKVREEAPAEEITLQANDNWMNEAMANFTGEQDVRKEAKADSEVVGKIYENTKVTVLVSSVLQTSAGRMIFAKMK